ncbi:hypothetical protein EDB86DRAFT_2917556, partial [Lactarius hatsudake]
MRSSATFLYPAHGRLTPRAAPFCQRTLCNIIPPTALPCSATTQALTALAPCHQLHCTSQRSASTLHDGPHRRRCMHPWAAVAQSGKIWARGSRVLLRTSRPARYYRTCRCSAYYLRATPDTEGAKAEAGPLLWTRPPLELALHHDLFPSGGHWGLESVHL